MNRSVSRDDERMLDRFLDEALSVAELGVCRRRLEQEPQLRAALQERKHLRQGFRAGRGQSFAAPADFASSVVVAARRLPVDRAEDSDLVVVCRRLLMAAAAILVVAALWSSGLFRAAASSDLQAVPDDVQRLIQELDAKAASVAPEKPRK
jgi:hypothetical protein